MSTAPNAIIETLFQSMHTLNVSASTAFDQGLAAMRESGDRVLHISSVLQTSLDLQSVLAIFVRETRDIVHFDSLNYKNAEPKVECNLGNKSVHSCTYSLDLAERTLGDITFTRKKRFSENELKVLEQLLCVLIYPLRNALLYQQAVQAATKDGLTNLYNRAALNDTLEREVKLAQRHNTPLSIIVLDIDHFKQVNDTYGHATGDLMIKSVADILIATARTSDLLYRYGGEEFVVLLPNTDLVGATQVGERIRQTVETACTSYHKNEPVKITASLGITAVNATDTEHTLFLRADQALYTSKQGGRNRTTVVN